MSIAMARQLGIELGVPPTYATVGAVTWSILSLSLTVLRGSRGPKDAAGEPDFALGAFFTTFAVQLAPAVALAAAGLLLVLGVPRLWALGFGILLVLTPAAHALSKVNLGEQKGPDE